MGNNVVYENIDGRDLTLDIYRPKKGEVSTRTAILMVHGGGWVHGSRETVAPLATALAERGFLAIGMEYRLAPEAPWPAQLDDIRAALRWVDNNARQLGVAKDRIVALGFSVGGHMALLAAAAQQGEPRFAAVVSLFASGEVSVGQQPPKGVLDATVILGPDATDEAIGSASPLQQLTPECPPVLLLHGGADWLVDPVASVRLYEKLVELSVTAELHIVAGAHHEFASEPGFVGAVAGQIERFLDRALIRPAHCAAESRKHNIFAQGPEALQALMAQMAEQNPG